MLAAYPNGTARPVPGFAEVMAAVSDGSVDLGVLPIENVVFGTVREVLDLLLDAEAVIVGEVIVPVRLCLAALPGERLEGIERVYSHIQALGQAEAFLRARFGDAFESYCASTPRLWPSFRGFRETDAYVVNPKLFRRTMVDVIWFVWLVGIVEFVEALHELHLVEPVMRLY